MSDDADQPHVRWIATAPTRPLCDVPWVGTSVVLSEGVVNFCCFSSAVVGNVNETSFEEIWNGEQMQRIRRELSAQRFPAECQSTSCPLYRGDHKSFLYKRMDGELTDAVSSNRPRIRATTLEVSAEQLNVGQTPEFALQIRYEGGRAFPSDLFIALRLPDSSFRFLPDYTEYPVPFARIGPPYVDEYSAKLLPKYFMQTGRYELCAALFEPDNNPNLLAGCYWAQTKHMQVQYEFMREATAAAS
jgi:hypothetical protein